MCYSLFEKNIYFDIYAERKTGGFVMKKKNSRESHPILRKVVEAMQLPRDCTLGSMNMIMTDKHQVFIENYRSIIEYTDTSLKLLGKNCRVHISGDRLRIVSYNADIMLVRGVFKEIKYL